MAFPEIKKYKTRCIYILG